jgi:hypothetical protein
VGRECTQNVSQSSVEIASSFWMNIDTRIGMIGDSVCWINLNSAPLSDIACGFWCIRGLWRVAACCGMWGRLRCPVFGDERVALRNHFWVIITRRMVMGRIVL